MTLPIADNLVVKMHYTLTDPDGQVLDSSRDADPLAYLHGAGNIIPGLEQALLGKVVGDELKVQVPPAEAYGEVNPSMIEVVPRAAFQGVESIEPGMSFTATSQDGREQRIVVTVVDGDDITVDGNHPLAGVELHFEVTVVEVREATAEEIAQGRAH